MARSTRKRRPTMTMLMMMNNTVKAKTHMAIYNDEGSEVEMKDEETKMLEEALLAVSDGVQ